MKIALTLDIFAYPHRSKARPEKHICQSTYIVYSRHAKRADRAIDGRAFPGTGGRDTAAAIEPDRRPGDMCLLLCGDFANQPAEDFAASRVPAPGGTDQGEARRQMDALQVVDAARSRGREHPARDIETFEAEPRNAQGQFAAQLRMLRAAEIRAAAGRSASHR